MIVATVVLVGAATTARGDGPRRAGRDWWSLQPLRPVVVPAAGDSSWSINPIDQFILERLTRKQLKPSPLADRRTLIRRLSFDLIGLPPTPREVEAFLNDNSPGAYERLVDRLLESPHYGERWARHWLDLVRFGESQGFERNKFRPNAWKYRDFVVEAFNADMPYDQFVRWQLAGDVLEPDKPLAVIASGFLVLGPYDLTAYTTGTAPMRAAAREEELEGLVATVGQTFLGLTVHCARCHNHKFDPISQREFYQFSAALGGIYQGDEREVLTKKGRAKVHVPQAKQPGPWHILARGDYRQPRDIVGPGGIAALRGISADWHLAPDAPEAERRKALARWITDPHNPLTPRVIVNRLWARHFGVGLVPTPSDFGFQGGLPSHPKLLDWLAAELVHPDSGRGWSLKHLQRLIVTSATYRQASRGVPEALQVDADNRLLWRQLPRRLEAEAFRDAVLAVSGELDLRLGGPGYRDFKVSSAGNNETYTIFDAVGGEFNRRSLYRTCLRAGTNPLLDLLDCPDPSVATPQRTVTSTPIQALALLNNRFMEYCAERFAARLQREAPDGAAAQVRRAYALAYARSPTDGELALGQSFVAQHGLTQLCLVLLNTSEFSYID